MENSQEPVASNDRLFLIIFSTDIILKSNHSKMEHIEGQILHKGNLENLYAGYSNTIANYIKKQYGDNEGQYAFNTVMLNFLEDKNNELQQVYLSGTSRSTANTETSGQGNVSGGNEHSPVEKGK